MVTHLPDDDAAVASAVHRARWHDHLQWANLLQFLGAGGVPGREAWMTTGAFGATLDVGDLFLCPTRAPSAEPAIEGETSVAELGPAQREELGLLVDDAVRVLVEMVLRRGAPPFVAGDEPPGELGSGIEIEAAWPQQKVAVVPDGEDDVVAWLAAHGWTVRPVSSWTEDDLMKALA